MNIIYILFLFLSLTHTQPHTLPPSQQINDLVFFQEKLFFLTASKKYFGFIQPQTGYFMMQTNVNEDEQVIGLDGANNFFALRKERNKALIFNLRDVNIQEINVQIRFSHQKIIDLMRIKQLFYVLTNKDFRKYNTQDKQMTDSPQNILTSCRKNQWFLKFFQYEDTFKIVLVRQQQICLRIVKQGQKAKQKCLFNISSEPHQISKIANGILVQTQSSNYVIKDDLDVFSFKGKITQVNHRFATFSDEFKCFYLQGHALIDGMDVYGSTHQFHFFLKESQEKQIILTSNGKIIENLGTKRPKRAWINQKDDNTFLLVLQYQQNNMIFKTISLDKNSSDPISEVEL